MQVLLCAI